MVCTIKTRVTASENYLDTISNSWTQSFMFDFKLHFKVLSIIPDSSDSNKFRIAIPQFQVQNSINLWSKEICMHLMIISSRHYLPLQPLYMPDGPVFTCELTFFGTHHFFVSIIHAINLLYSHSCCKREKSTR